MFASPWGNVVCSRARQFRRAASSREGAAVKSTSLLFAVLLAGVTVAAQQREQIPVPLPDDEEGAATATVTQVAPPTTFRAGVDLVALSVVVTDSSQNFVNGLDQANF